MALGLDQVPESLLPLLAVQPMLTLTVIDVETVVVVFSVSGLTLSRVLY
jgi:CDP-2,3-bis-(O-geranylgeranyl)-sn-glycerol synthase